MVNKVANWIVRNRLVVLAVLLCVTGFFAWKIINIDISTQLSDLLPQKHPYIKGGGPQKLDNVVSSELDRKRRI